MPRFRHHSLRTSGFTLVEVLITFVIGSLILGAVTSVHLSQVRTETVLDTSLLLRQQANRAARWIDNEAFRAYAFDSEESENCEGPSDSVLRFSMLFNPDNPVRVSFYSPADGTYGNVVRCGPPVVCTDGSACALDSGAAPVTYLVTSDAQLSVNPALGSSPVRSVRYTLDLRSRDINTDLTRSAFAGAPDFAAPSP